MENYIVIGMIVLAVGFGILSAVRHFRGRGGCCGGGGEYRVKRKRLKQVRYTKVFRVEGMHCAHCRNRVEEIVNDIPGAAGRVNLKRGELTLRSTEEIDETQLRNRLERAGYTLL